MRAPIKSRTMFYSTPGKDKTIRLLDWCLVDTAVGACVEPRQLRTQLIGANLTNRTLEEEGITRLEQMDENKLFRLLGTGGQQLPVDYALL